MASPHASRGRRAYYSGVPKQGFPRAPKRIQGGVSYRSFQRRSPMDRIAYYHLVYNDGRPKRVIGVNIDIAERKRAEVALQASEAKFAGILAIAGDAIVSIDSNHRITLVRAHRAVHIGSRYTWPHGRAAGSAWATPKWRRVPHRWQGISLAELVRRELAPYATRDNTEINGPDISLKSEAGQ